MTSKGFTHYGFASRDFSSSTLEALEERGFYIVGVQMLPDMTSSMPWANADTGYVVADLEGAGSVKTYKEVIALSKAPKAQGLEGVLEVLTEIWEGELVNWKDAKSLEARSYNHGLADAYKRSIDMLRAYIKDAPKEPQGEPDFSGVVTEDDGVNWVNGRIYNSHVFYNYRDHLAILVWLGKARQWGWLFGDIRSHEAFEDILFTIRNFREFINKRTLRAASDFEENSDGE